MLKTDFDKPKKIIVSRPYNLDTKEIIDPITKYYNSAINKELALKQHEELISVLKDERIKVVEIENKYPYSVFTRDLGVLLNNNLFVVGNLRYSIRKRETEILKEKLKELKINYIEIKDFFFEGGNIIIYDKDLIFLGISERTDEKAINFFKQYAEVIPIKLPKEFIHLDLALNFASRDLAIGYIDFKFNDINYLKINMKYWYKMVPNFLVLKEYKIIAPEENRDFLRILEKEGVDIIYVPFSEIMKAGGAVRCATLPIERS